MAKNETSYCEPLSPRLLSGYFYGANPINSPFPRFLLQMTLMNAFTFFFQFLLLPFQQPTFVSQILSAIAFGPSVLGQNENFTRKMFPASSEIMLSVYQLVGIMLFYFMVGLRIDMGIIKHTGKLAIIIGIATFFIPLLTTGVTSLFLISHVTMKKSLLNSLQVIAVFESETSFHVMSVVLSDLNLLNSELGRLAMSSSLISDIIVLIILTIAIYETENSSDVVSRRAVLPTNVSRILMILVIVLLFRRIMFWIIRRTPEGKSLKESYVCLIFVMLLVSAFYGEYNGLDFMTGPLIFGLVIPTGPPIATSLLDKLSCLVSALFIPCYIAHLSFKVDVMHIGLESVLIVVCLIIVATITKLVVVVLISLYFKVPLVDAIALGLLVNCKGLFNIQLYDRAASLQNISEDTFKVMVIMALIRTAIFTPIVRALYDPSRRYVAYKRRTIQHSKPNAELRFIACVHNQTVVPSIISLMEITNPTRSHPVGLYVLDLVELSGRSASLFIAHKLEKVPSSKQRTRIDQIMNAFSKLELQTLGNMVVQYFTAISPYATIHDDICTLALEKSASLVIMPFQRSDSLTMRTINKNVLEKAPCSVGILISPTSLHVSWFNVCLLFIGGPDDREALAYATRMVEHPKVNLRLLRIHSTDEDGDNNFIEKKLDMQALSDIKMKAYTNLRIEYNEENVKDVAGTTQVIGSLKNGFDIIIVGRGHDQESPVLKGMAAWCEFKELGVLGDLLVSADYSKANASVLVVQQQASVVERMLDV